MYRSLMLLFTPMTGWQKIANQSWHVLVVFLFSIGPIMVASCAVEGWTMLKFGAGKGPFGNLIELEPSRILSYEILQLALGIVLVFAGGKFIQWVCGGFQTEATYRQSFTLTAYGLTPVFWLRFLDGLPAIPTWICWALAAIAIMVVLYHGVALILQPSTSIGFGLYLVSSASLVALSGITHFVATGILTEQFDLPAFLKMAPL
ncbi:MAG: YIP1 family protein [Verrucomicrobiales bacterium]